MKKILLFDPSISSMNNGDAIISIAAKKHLSYLLNSSIVVDISTHLPVSINYMRYFKDVDYRFVLGSNLLKTTVFGLKKQWDISLIKSKFIGPCVLMGVGWWQYNNLPNLYTKYLLNSVLSKKYIHSVRDEYTLNILKNIGIHNVVNTGCPTMWELDSQHCSKINKHKAENVVFTLTDYHKDIELDRVLINKLGKIYNHLYFWPQGYYDMNYLLNLRVQNKKITILDPSIHSLDFILERGNIDYVGTRLHGGIRALQKGIRTLIIAIDNRATEIHEKNNIPILQRSSIKELERVLQNNIETQIIIPEEKILLWKKQFN